MNEPRRRAAARTGRCSRRVLKHPNRTSALLMDQVLRIRGNDRARGCKTEPEPEPGFAFGPQVAADGGVGTDETIGESQSESSNLQS